MKDNFSHVQLEAEQAVLGSMLIDRDIVRDVLYTVRPEDFIQPNDQDIFLAARDLFREGKPVDAITIRERLGIEFTDYLVQLMEITPTSANWAEYARIMQERALWNRVTSMASRMHGAADLDEFRAIYAQLGPLLADGRELKEWTVSQMLDSFYKSQDHDAPKPEYVSFGLGVLDEGSYIEPGDVVVIGGNPSDGKTALGLQIAWHMAERRKVGFFSLETARRKLRDRLIAHAMGLDLADIKRRNLSDGDWAALAERQNELVRHDLTLVEAAGMTAADIEAASQAYGFQAIVVDYVQLIQADKTGNRSEQLAAVSRALHTFAQRTGTLVVELAQLARQERSSGRGEARRDPVMQDLKESGQLEQDADMILLLFRPGPKDTGPDGNPLSPKEHRMLKIAKNKEGRWGTWPLFFDGGKQTFSLLADGMKTMRRFQSEGRKAKTRNRTEREQVTFTEVTGEAAAVPF